MNSKFFLAAFIACVISCNASGQVNLQKGSFETSIPLYGFKDPFSNLSLNLSLNYSSGNGILVDEIPSCIGQGWNLGGLGVITRVQRGTAPDDQRKMETGEIQYRYPDGYIFNPIPVTDGCNTLLNKYPLYSYERIQYHIRNSINGDKEQDYFIFSFNGRTGKFVIDKNKDVHVLGDNRLKIKRPLFDEAPINGCRTLINKFIIIDETGIEYEFGVRDFSKSYDYYDPTQIFGKRPSLLKPHEIPDSYNPFISNNWYLSLIRDPLNGRVININYKTDVINMFSSNIIQMSVPEGPSRFGCSSWQEGTDPIFELEQPLAAMSSISVLKQKMFTKKPEVINITLPTAEAISFTYSAQRKDCKGSYKLSEISIVHPLVNYPENFIFQQSYFVKNTIKEPLAGEEKFSRLALQTVSKSTVQSIQRLANFDYYTGANTSENFVPPIFFHAKDPWGYYNGDYCGVDVNDLVPDNRFFAVHSTTIQGNCFYLSDAEILANYNSVPYTWYLYGGFSNNNTNPYIISNAKTQYAANGLLNSITNKYGGKTNIKYEQNKFHEPPPIAHFSNTNWNRDINIVGGVHVSAIFEQESESAPVTVTNYKYSNEDGYTSSLWGAEFPCNVTVFNSFYRAEDRYFNITSCDYNFKYPGELGHIIIADGGQSFEQNAIKIFQYAKIADQVIKVMSSGNLRDLNSLWASLLFSILTTCFGDNPSEKKTYFNFTNSALNFGNAIPIQFRRVEVEKTNFSSTQNNGKIVYEFTSPNDTQFPLLVSQNYFPYTNKPRFYDWAYGLPKSVKIFDRNNKLINSTENHYEPVLRGFTGVNTASCNCISSYSASMRGNDYLSSNGDFSNVTITGSHTNSEFSPALFVENYNQNAGHAELRHTTQKVYDMNDNFMETTTEYEYNASNFQVSNIKTKNSDDKIIEKKIYYPENFDIPLTGTSAIPDLIYFNMVNIPVVTETWQTKGGAKELISFNATDFEKIANGIKPAIDYSLIAPAPIPLTAAGTLGPTSIVRNLPAIKPVTTTLYDANGNAVQANNLITDKVASTVYGYKGEYPIANISNAARNEVAYTSFENNEGGDWAINAGGFDNTIALTGKTSLYPNFNIVSPQVQNSKKYKLSFWIKPNAPNGGTLMVNNQAPDFTGPEIDGWKYHEYSLASGFTSPVVINGFGRIDEVRLYPANAAMNTVTYQPSVGKSSECDDNNRVSYFEYDSFGRLIIVRDAKKSIIKTYEYRYKQ